MFLEGSESIGSTWLAYLHDMAKSKTLAGATTIALSERLLAHTLQGFKEVVHTFYLIQFSYIQRSISWQVTSL